MLIDCSEKIWKLWVVLLEMKASGQFIYIIHSSYVHNNAVIRLEKRLSNLCMIKNSVTQRCILPPSLSNVY